MKRLIRYGDENEALMEAGQQALSCAHVNPSTIECLFGGDDEGSSGAFLDADLDRWIGNGRFQTMCGEELMKQLMLKACVGGGVAGGGGVVKARQQVITCRELHLHRLQKLMAEAKTLEQDALWVLDRPDIKKTWPLPFLFPTMVGLRELNKVPLFHEFYHFSRLIASPALTVLYPIGLILGPWMYFRYKLGWQLSFKAYIAFAVKMICTLKGGVAIKVWTTLALYTGLYLYSVAQVVDLARMVGAARQTLVARQAKVARLMTIAESVREMCGGDTGIMAFLGEGDGDGEVRSVVITPGAIGFKGIWQWWGDPLAASSIRNALKILAVADVVAVGATCTSNVSRWCAVEWVVADGGNAALRWPRFYGMRHPALGVGGGVANPAALDKNIILTGPNAAGKTTYCRGLLANVILAQTLGIACARRATMGGLFGGIASFMRISDETGSASLFEAEVARCIEMWRMAEQQDAPVFMVLDEPMHATPPTEGAAAAMAFMKGLAQMKGGQHVRLIATTHYAALTSLAFEESRIFINVSMEAILQRGKKIAFPYKLRSGPSFQSIALELMQEQGAFPNAFVEDALRIKEKLGGREVVS